MVFPGKNQHFYSHLCSWITCWSLWGETRSICYCLSLPPPPPPPKKNKTEKQHTQMSLDPGHDHSIILIQHLYHYYICSFFPIFRIRVKESNLCTSLFLFLLSLLPLHSLLSGGASDADGCLCGRHVGLPSSEHWHTWGCACSPPRYHGASLFTTSTGEENCLYTPKVCPMCYIFILLSPLCWPLHMKMCLYTIFVLPAEDHNLLQCTLADFCSTRIG